MGEFGGKRETEQPSAGALNRRNMLKAAVAAGAGAAAWTAPDIKTLGFKPALAAAASGPIVTEFSDAQSLNANCNSGAPCNAIPSPEWGNSGNPGEIDIKAIGNQFDTIVSVHQVGDVSTGGCAFQANEATVTTQPAGYTCVITSIFLNCAVGGNTIGNFTEYPVTPALTVPVPVCDNNGTSAPCNYFIRAAVSCTPNP